MTKNSRIIFHVDMDHFYTAIEENKRAELKGKPLIVGADPKEGKGRGVVSTCNYEAREFGVRSGMPISRAWRLCPEGTYLPVDFKLYRKVSERIMRILGRFSDRFERWGVDEAFLNVTSRVNNSEEAEDLANRIEAEIYSKERLTCSIGIGPNKLAAKMASDFQKPDGLTVVHEGAVQEFLSPLPVRKLLWVGRKTEQKLRKMGIETIGDLAGHDPATLIDNFGIVGTQLHLMARGIDTSRVEERSQVKSIGRDVTFEEDTDDFESVLRTLDKLAEAVHNRSLKRNFSFKTVTIRVRYENFETHTHGKTLTVPTTSLQELQKTVKALMQDYLHSQRKIRLVGVRISNFVSLEKQRTLV